MKINKKIIYFLIYCGLFVLLGLLSTNKTSAQICEGGNWTEVILCSANPGTRWEINFYYKYADARPDLHRYIVVDTPGTTSGCPSGTDYYEPVPIPNYSTQYKPMNGDRVRWLSACVDPAQVVTPDVSSYCEQLEGTFYLEYIDVTCRTGYSENHCIYGGCGSPNNQGYIAYNQACPSNINQSDHCIYQGNIETCPVTNCVNDCTGRDTAWQCVRNINKCSSSSYNCVTTDTRPLNDNCGSKSNCTNPPGNRTDSAFCQGTQGTDRAAGIDFEWNKMPYDSGYDLQYRRTSSSTWNDVNVGTSTSGDGKIHKRIPGSGCETPSCDLGYNVQYEWRVRENLSTGSWTETEWSDIRTQTTNDCGAKPDLKITGFTFPGGNSGGTSDARVTVFNDSQKGTGADFNVRVNNGGGTPDIKSVSAGGSLPGGGSREVTVPGLQRPNANKQGSPWVATATVDPGNVIAEANENNNDATDNYNTTSHVSGVIFIDTNGNTARDTGEPLYTGNATVRVVDVTDNITKDYPTTTGSYTSNEEDKGDYNVRIPTPPPSSQYIRTTPLTLPETVNFGGNQTVNFGYRPLSSSITIHVYTDLNSIGVDDGDAPYQGAVITVTGNGAEQCVAPDCKTDANGNYTLSNLNAGTSNITLVDPPPPSGWTVTTTNPRNGIVVPPGQVVNFGVQPPAPICTTLTHSPATAVTAAGQTRTLTLNCTGIRGTPTYYWGAQSGTVPATSATNTVTWTSNDATMTDSRLYNDNLVDLGAQVVDSATGLPSNFSQDQIPVQNLYSVSGSVFLDTNQDETKDGGEPNHDGGSINSSGGAVAFSGGNYTVSGLVAGTYSISYSQPAGYFMTYPKAVPPTFTITVGPGCIDPDGGTHDASCVSGDVEDLNFGVTDAVPWIQSGGSDVWLNSGINNSIPTGATCGPYMSNNGAGGTPGVIYSGGSSYNFGGGQASLNPYNWIVGGLTYPELYTPSTAGVIKTSYNYINSLVSQNNITVIDIATVCDNDKNPATGNLATCDLPADLDNGVYRANGELTITDTTNSFRGNKDFVILVDGNLNINTTIDVPTGSTALFTADEDINVGANVGTNNQSNTTENTIEGWFSADRNFNILEESVCPTADRRLNVEGAIVVNASLQGGSFVNNRSLCAGDSSCPVFYVRERPDFVLNAPLFLQSTRRVWQEIAP